MNIAFDPLPRFFSIGIPALKRRNSRIYTSGDFIFQQKKKINTNAIPSVYREWWRQKVPKIFSPVPSMNYQKPTEHIEEEDRFAALAQRLLNHAVRVEAKSISF